MQEDVVRTLEFCDGLGKRPAGISVACRDMGGGVRTLYRGRRCPVPRCIVTTRRRSRSETRCAAF